MLVSDCAVALTFVGTLGALVSEVIAVAGGDDCAELLPTASYADTV
jgi:hypothetical protein